MFRKNSVKDKIKDEFSKKNGEDSQDSGEWFVILIIKLQKKKKLVNSNLNGV